MLQLLQARNFRMLRSNSVALRPFHVLVGQNATGKSTLLGALQFLSDILEGGVESAVERVAPSFYDLCFDRDLPIALAVELALPGIGDDPRQARYEIEVGIDESGLRVLRENLFLKPAAREPGVQASLFDADESSLPVVSRSTPKSWRKVVSKTAAGRDYFRGEKTNWNNVFRFGLDKAALGSLPEDPDRFPLSIAVRYALRDGIRTLALTIREMRRAAPPGGQQKMKPDGSNLPDVVKAFKKRDPVLFEQWVQEVGLAVEGLDTIGVREREEDKHLILEATFRGQHRAPVPSWLLSDGTLRLIALTLLGYAESPDDLSFYLIEEPENGLHPLAIQVVYDVLSRPSLYTQFLTATHSPIFLAHAALDQALVFRRSREGTAIVRRGTEIPELREWAESTNISDLFVTGVLA